MLSYIKNSENLVIIIHEIYGVNNHMKYISNLITNLKFDVICPNLFPFERTFEECQEDEAYINFVNKVGLETGASVIKDLIENVKDKYNNIYLIGFSVGATIAWLCSESVSTSGIVCFYGSRIRNYTHIEPKCPTTLFFATNEKAFDVKKLAATLQAKKNHNICLHMFHATHGFTNPYSKNFCKETFEHSLNLMKKALMNSTEVSN